MHACLSNRVYREIGKNSFRLNKRPADNYLMCIGAFSHIFSLFSIESQGQFTFTLPVNVKIAPLAKVLVYLVLESGEVIADSVNFKIEKCFTNKVRMCDHLQ